MGVGGGVGDGVFVWRSSWKHPQLWCPGVLFHTPWSFTWGNPKNEPVCVCVLHTQVCWACGAFLEGSTKSPRHLSPLSSIPRGHKEVPFPAAGSIFNSFQNLKVS